MSTEVQKRKNASYQIFNEVAATYDFLNHLLSMGIDVYWRKQLLKLLPQKRNIHAIDLATGTADVALTLAESAKISKVTGIDLSTEMLKIAQKKVTKKGQEHKISLQVGDGQAIPANNESADVITISFGIRNFPDPEKSLRDCHRVLTTGGRILIMEFSIPKNWFFRKIYFFYFRHILPFVGNLISKHKDAYKYLNESVEDFPYGEEFSELMKKSGFQNIHYKTLTFGIATIYRGDKIK